MNNRFRPGQSYPAEISGFYATKARNDFPDANEYFKWKWDTGAVNLSFNRHFGKPLKTNRRSSGSSGDEIQRTGSGG